jgi:hypothetical protein
MNMDILTKPMGKRRYSLKNKNPISILNKEKNMKKESSNKEVVINLGNFNIKINNNNIMIGVKE